MTLARIALAACLSTLPAVAAPQSQDVPRELWDRPRTASAVLAEESIRQTVLAVLAKPGSRLVIRHGMGQEPLLHAEELRSWLGSLAVDTRRIVLRADLAAGAPLKLEVMQ